jgi:hypothetical protein
MESEKGDRGWSNKNMRCRFNDVVYCNGEQSHLISRHRWPRCLIGILRTDGETGFVESGHLTQPSPNQQAAHFFCA